MLSTENPPPDLCQNSQLKSLSSDEKTCDNNQLDLFTHDNNPLPNFSIRDYVYNTRGKDIKNNWPFSQKNLQLCLKHGVKDVLPPFQSLDSVRNQSIVEEENLRDSDVKFHSVAVNLSVDIEKEKSVADKVVSLPIESPNKAETTIQSPIKKCRLIVKLNNISSNEDLAVNNTLETMASKVCPVCKTFSSSSNTTLNAHIDQCLSGEAPVKCPTNSKVIKHRIKPRKTRLMADVYKTALHCTLEDLDRRNGTNWSPNRGPQPDDLEEACAEAEKKAYSSVNTEDVDQDDAVYIDSNGTKLRILSKLSHLPSKSDVNNNAGSSKFVRRDLGKKLLSSKTKKHIVQKHKPQKHSLDGQGSCSPGSDHLLDYPPPNGSPSCYNGHEVEIGQPKLFHFEGYKESDPTQPIVASDQMKSDDFGMIKRWVGSKRTGLKKKFNLVHENQHLDKSTKNLRVKSVSSLSKGSTASMSPISSGENPVVTTESESCKRMENLCNSEDGFIGLSRLRKRPAFPLLASQHSSDKNSQLMFSKFNVKQSSKVTENHFPSRCNKKMLISSNSHIQEDSSFIHPNGPQHHGISPEGKKFASLRKPSSTSSGNKKFSSLRTKLLSVRHASVTELKKNSGRKLLNIKNTRTSHSDDEEAFVSRSALRRQNSMVETLGGRATLPEKSSGQPLINRTRVLKIPKKVGRVWNTGEEDMTSNESDSPSGGNNAPIDTSNDVEEEADEMMDEFASEPNYGMPDGEAFASFSKSLDTAFPGLADSSNVECGSHYYNSNELVVLNGDRDNVGAEMDADEAQGNYFVDVEPIPIPGPPGSFLPSPGRMGSEELQGHSSLTTCRLQSSEEGHGVVDMDSSDSPVSGISGVSNSIAGRSNPISITNLSHFQGSSPFKQVASGDRELNLLESMPEMSHEARDIQLCCCARKDGSLQGVSLNYQESQILRRRTMTSNGPKNEIHCLNVGPATLSEKVSNPEPKKHAANSYPPSPSTPNPVLRLMGKNLMVVNKDDNLSPRTMPVAIDHASSRWSGENGRNEVNSFHHNLSQVNLQPHIPVQFNSSDGFKAPANHGPMLPSSNFVGSLASRCHGFASGFNLIADQLGSKIRLDSRTIYDAERVGTESSGGKHKDIIVIDESPETKAAGGSVRAAAPSMALHSNPFYNYQTRVYPHFTGSPVVQNGNNTNLGKWNIAEGNSNSSTAPLPSAVHLRSSSIYFSPGFS